MTVAKWSKSESLLEYHCTCRSSGEHVGVGSLFRREIKTDWIVPAVTSQSKSIFSSAVTLTTHLLLM